VRVSCAASGVLIFHGLGFAGDRKGAAVVRAAAVSSASRTTARSTPGRRVIRGTAPDHLRVVHPDGRGDGELTGTSANPAVRDAGDRSRARAHVDAERSDDMFAPGEVGAARFRLPGRDRECRGRARPCLRGRGRQHRSGDPAIVPRVRVICAASGVLIHGLGFAGARKGAAVVRAAAVSSASRTTARSTRVGWGSAGLRKITFAFVHPDGRGYGELTGTSAKPAVRDAADPGRPRAHVDAERSDDMFAQAKSALRGSGYPAAMRMLRSSAPVPTWARAPASKR